MSVTKHTGVLYVEVPWRDGSRLTAKLCWLRGFRGVTFYRHWPLP